MHGNNQYIIKGHTPIDELNERLNAEFNEDTYDTIGGIVMAHFGYYQKGVNILCLIILNLK